jgi:hypothetical protein
VALSALKVALQKKSERDRKKFLRAGHPLPFIEAYPATRDAT